MLPPGTSGPDAGPGALSPRALRARSRKTYDDGGEPRPSTSAWASVTASPTACHARLPGVAPEAAISTTSPSSAAQPPRNVGSRSEMPSHAAAAVAAASHGAPSGASGGACAGRVVATAGALQRPLPAALTAATVNR